MEGPFIQVLDFLRSLENLQVFVITDDLSVVAARASKDEAIKVRLGLTLLAYGAERSAVKNGGHDSIVLKLVDFDCVSLWLIYTPLWCGDDRHQAVVEMVVVDRAIFL